MTNFVQRVIVHDTLTALNIELQLSQIHPTQKNLKARLKTRLKSDVSLSFLCLNQGQRCSVAEV